MSDRTSDGRPPRKAGAGKPRGNFGSARGNQERGGPGKGGSRGGKPGFGRTEGGSRNFGDKRRDATSGERPITGRNKDERPNKSFGNRPFGAKSSGERPFRNRDGEGGKPEGRPFRERKAEGGGFQGSRSEGRTFGGKPFADRKSGDRPAPDRDARKPGAGRPFRERQGDRPSGDRPSGDRPRAPRAHGDRPSGDRPQGDRSYGDRPARAPRRDQDAPRRTGRFVRSDDSEAASAQSTAAHGGGRIAKVIARAGACSRRDAEVWITEGRVAVNGTVLDSPAFNVGPDDKITIDGKPLAGRERTRLFLFHKPRGLVTTNSDPEGRPTIFDALPDNIPRLVSVGRLDINTEGLMLLTNDGGLARVLELPATGWLRRYRVRAHGETNQHELDKLRDGITVEGIEYRGIEARIDREQGANLWLTIGLREGKNREVKRVLESLGLEVNRLIRISYGPFQLAELGEGALDEVSTRILKDQLGEKLAQEASADFDAPIFDRREQAPRIEVESTGRGSFGAHPRSRDASDEAHGPRPGTEPPRKRKHISASREIARERETNGERTRVEKSETADRKGRAVPVERRVSPGWRDRDDAPDTRNARRFASERGESPPRRREAREEGSAAPRREWSERPPRREGGDRPPRREAGERPPRRDFGDRPPRRDAGERPPRREGGDRPPRREFSERPPRREGGDSPPRREAGERPPRREFSERPPRRDSGDRPPRREAGDRPPRREFSERPPRRDEGDRPKTYAARSAGPRKSADGKFGGEKEFGAKRSFGDRPTGARPPRKPSGDRPSGGRPSGGRPGGDRPPRKPRNS